LLLGFIKGPLVDNWVKCWTQWAINQFTINHRPPTNEYYWTQISNGFQTTFQDTGTRERAEKELHLLRWDPDHVDMFFTRFESLAKAANFKLDANPTKSILAWKLPYSMVDHLYKVVKLGTYPEYCEAIQQFHADNTVVQNIKGYQNSSTPQKKDRKNFLGRYSQREWAKILGVDLNKVKMPKRSDAMDTSTRSRSKFNRTRGQVAKVEKPDTDTQRKEGCCFTCNQQGHLSKNCPQKEGSKKKAPIKGRAVETEASEADVSSSKDKPDDLNSFLKRSKALKTDTKLTILKMARDAEKGQKVELEAEEEDF
jgi:hypothetical protein